MDARAEELRHAHDVLSEWYAENLVGVLERMPVERAVLDLFAELTLAVGTQVADVGCGTGRLLPYLAGRGLSPRGVDLSPGMVEVARREHPGFTYEVADLRALPFGDASLAGVVCWFSLIYLAPDARVTAFAELARVVRPGGYLVAAFKHGDGTLHRNAPGSRVERFGVDFDRYWLSAREMEDRFAAAGFGLIFQGSTPPEGAEPPYGYMLVRRAGS
ncbi:class I SAM-dependent methyltransferase [Dactylosporangium aurantiacum]|uniref:Class I SAM-dependent methyltransferase n=1 Tax=Dactylosporangium aurantiacum TaxID=35754 RepID=A0A9Q9IBS5_9ACTN|nr:class I SAM-dependent methyltransferase [Dactylosporangium aurantiacum]MDG6108720.1 class I SAM-dependent methyltransferase [Dactylosporangium aurantiacum]UWZ51082.1 class I SAM-dependent methyltransferase [Dactylosporangium aurantiacum]